MVTLLERTTTPTPEATFLALYDREGPLVLRYLRAWAPAGADVEDLVAEAFTRAWRAWPRFQGGEPEARAWLLRIARNHAIGTWRRGRHVRLVAIDEDLPDARTPGTGIDRIELAAALAHLSREERDLVALRAAGLSHAEIGALTGRSEAAAKMAWHRAATRLRPHLDREA
ncbi:MAG TPA: sigma-70 family RNA polymerase sigma factor [Candidatus Dormibacteraeota bacterium]|jgi:RNA polymerase sigma-70 factor (ECF subfamily)|nr:sigma-70 family RNA polymerase sigma factor [Candidatus Dormibacteraeota bacterium]